MNYLRAYKTLFCAFSWLYLLILAYLSSRSVKICVNPLLINDLRRFKALYNCRDTFTDVMSPLQIKLFMQNKPNFRKSQMNVNKVLTKAYDKMDTWSIGKNKANTKPIQTQFKPNTKPIQTQSNPNKPKQTQCLPAISVAGQREKNDQKSAL
ncbi:MAG: hypothetical protein WBC22_17030 [Sedimentisphaerales bacterium]